MFTIEHNGKSYEVDEQFGFLVGFTGKLDPNWVDYVKVENNIGELTEEHQGFIDGVREYYRKNKTTPWLSIAAKYTGIPPLRIKEIFGSIDIGLKMAGLPNTCPAPC